MSSALKNCPACNKEVSKSAKICPHCGKKLKTGLFIKILAGLIVLMVIGVIIAPSEEEKAQQLASALDGIAKAQAEDISPSGTLRDLFSFGSKYTDIQRDNAEKEMKGKIVQWTLPVYEVSKLDEDRYRVQTQSNGTYVDTFIKLYTRNAEERAYMEGLQTDDPISFKGRIVGTSMRSIDIEPAILIK